MPSSESGDDTLVWYAGYGSNLDPDRFACYLLGGRPPGATRDYPGTRDREPALDTRHVELEGGLFFGWDSPTWGGVIAFYDPATTGPALARPALATAYLLTRRQFADVVEQEMWRKPGVDHDLAEVLAAGRHQLAPGRYETLHLAGSLDGRPVLTFSCPEPRAIARNEPAAAYLDTMARGLEQVHGLGRAEVEAYLARW